MTAPSFPSAEDLVIQRQSPGAFTIGATSRPPQIRCRTLEEAIQRAAGFATEQGVGLWCATEDGTYVRIADPRLLRAIWNEYVEMPGLRLTQQQAQRLWTVERQTCASVLDGLVELKILARERDGTYTRLRGGEMVTPLRMARGDVIRSRPAGPRRRAG
jgi:hypothetical protein